MWYPYRKKEVDYSMPIMAERKDDVKYLLIPQINTQANKSVITQGYNWFNVDTGVYNSCTCWDSAEDAVDCYIDLGYLIYNVRVGLNKL